jgi:hypothetical protein
MSNSDTEISTSQKEIAPLNKRERLVAMYERHETVQELAMKIGELASDEKLVEIAELLQMSSPGRDHMMHVTLAGTKTQTRCLVTRSGSLVEWKPCGN